LWTDNSQITSKAGADAQIEEMDVMQQLHERINAFLSSCIIPLLQEDRHIGLLQKSKAKNRQHGTSLWPN
jgi:GTP cyclohydrolase II